MSVIFRRAGHRWGRTRTAPRSLCGGRALPAGPPASASCRAHDQLSASCSASSLSTARRCSFCWKGWSPAGRHLAGSRKEPGQVTSILAKAADPRPPGTRAEAPRGRRCSSPGSEEPGQEAGMQQQPRAWLQGLGWPCPRLHPVGSLPSHGRLTRVRQAARGERGAAQSQGGEGVGGGQLPAQCPPPP